MKVTISTTKNMALGGFGGQTAESTKGSGKEAFSMAKGSTRVKMECGRRAGGSMGSV